MGHETVRSEQTVIAQNEVAAGMIAEHCLDGTVYEIKK